MEPLKLVFVFLLQLSFACGMAQQTAIYTDMQEPFKRGMHYFDLGMYGLAQTFFREAMASPEMPSEPDHAYMRTLAELYHAKAAVRLEAPGAERLVLDFIQRHAPDPIATEANLEIAHYYYNERKYDEAIRFYRFVDNDALTLEKRAEVAFKYGYCLFVRDDAAAAKGQFLPVKDIETAFYYPINYYYGMCQYLDAEYESAASSFRKVAQSELYNRYVPYYLTQIYFIQGKYQDVIDYGLTQLDKKHLHQEKDIRHLIGKAWYEMGNYAEAVPHLEYYEANSGRMEETDFYQLGYALYMTGACEKAVSHFRQLNNRKNALGQNASYYMADCFLKTGDVTSARTAFHTVSRLDFDSQIQEEARFNYGKLSAQMGYDNDAIRALRQIGPASPHYPEAQMILKEVFLHTKDFASAFQTLEKIEDKTPALREAYQSVCLNWAIQLLNDKKIGRAIDFLDRSLDMPVDQSLKARALFWKAEIKHHAGSYQESADLYRQYFSLAKTGIDLPLENSVPIAQYNQGYNHFKLEAYKIALGYFQDALDGLRKEDRYANSYFQDQIYPDALLRAGDCQFKRNAYQEALSYYNQSIALRKYGFVYAKYQKAMILGLIGKQVEKIVVLEELERQYPKSRFADDALYQLSVTYQELDQRDQAVPVLEKLVRAYPTSSLVNRSYLSLGLISYNNGDLNAAITYYKTIFNNNPGPAEAREAITALEEIYVNDLSDPDGYFAFREKIPGYKVSTFQRDSVNFVTAEILYENGQYEKAIEAYSAYLKKFPEGVNRLHALYHRAESYGVLKEYRKARVDYEAIVGLGQSALLETALTKAALIAYNDEEDFEKAHQYYLELIDLASNEDLRYEAQIGALRSGYRIQNNKTVLAMAEAVLESPKSSPEEKALAHFLRGKIAFARKQYDAALNDLNAVTRLSDNVQTAEARYLIVRIYFTRVQLDLAEKLAHNANKENSNYPYWVAKTLILLSDIYVEKSDLFNARAALEAVIENFTGESSIVIEARDKLDIIKQREDAQNRLKKDSTKTMELQYNENQ